MAVQVKCPHCQQKGNKEEMVKIKNRYWHEECLEEHNQSVSVEDLQQERDKEEYKLLISYICDLFDKKRPSMHILSQIKKFHTELEMRYYAIQLCLEYFFVIKDNPIGEGNTIGIVPYIKEDAEKYYLSLAKVNSMEEFEYKHKETVIRQPRKTRDRKKHVVNMNEL